MFVAQSTVDTSAPVRLTAPSKLHPDDALRPRVVLYFELVSLRDATFLPRPNSLGYGPFLSTETFENGVHADPPVERYRQDPADESSQLCSDMANVSSSRQSKNFSIHAENS